MDAGCTLTDTIISRTNSQCRGRPYLNTFIGPANNDQSLCYAGGYRPRFQVTFGDPFTAHRVIVLSPQSIMTDPRTLFTQSIACIEALIESRDQ